MAAGGGAVARNLGKGWNIKYPATPIEEAKAAIGNLVLSMQKADFQRKVGIEVTEVFKGGSLGHGTAVEHHFDIDLVLYSRDLNVGDAVKYGYDQYFDKIDSYLAEHFGDGYSPEDEHTDVAIKFAIQLPRQRPIEVDLILSPYFSDQHDLLRSLRTVDKSKRLKLFSASASKWQTQFLRYQDNWVKELIRRTKAWKNIEWQDEPNEGRPKSYFLSILVIIAYARVPAEMRVRRKKGLRKLVPTMTREFKALILEIWDNQHLNLSVPGTDGHFQVTYGDLLPDIPRIIDPVNPANNLYLSGITRSKRDDNKWRPFRRKIHSLDLSPEILRKHQRVFQPGL